MSRIALACAVALATLFTTGAQADAAGYKRHKPHVAYHYKAKKKTPVLYKAHKRAKARRHIRHRYATWRKRHGKRYHFARRYR